MSETTFTVRLGDADYDSTVGGWRCPALRIPKAEVDALYVNGARVDEKTYNVKGDYIRYSGEKPTEASVAIEFGRTMANAKWLKMLAIVLPVVGTLGGAAITGYASIAAEAKKEAQKQAQDAARIVRHEFVVLKPGSTGPTESTVSLRFDNNVILGEGAADDKSWKYSGYLNAGFMVLANRSVTPDGIGFGVHIFESARGTADEYVGSWRGNWCNDKVQPAIREIRECPVVLVRGSKGGLAVDAAKKKYQALLKPGGCVVQPLTKSSPALSCPPL